MRPLAVPPKVAKTQDIGQAVLGRTAQMRMMARAWFDLDRDMT